MYFSSSLSPLSLSLSEVLVSDSSLPLLAKQSSSDSMPSRKMYFCTSAQNLCGCDACGGGTGGGPYIQDSASSVPFVLQVS